VTQLKNIGANLEEHEFEKLGKSELEQNDPEQDDLEQDDFEPDDLEQDDLEQDDFEQDDFEQDSLEDGEDIIVEVDRSLPVVPTPGCAVSFYTDNKRHHAVCLAVINDELLLEHKGASRCFLFTGKVVEIVQRLRFGVASATITVGMLKSCRYRSVPKKWLQEMIKTGQTWKGIERGGELAPQPCDLVKDNGQLELF
jgi:hypothetical protein